MFNIKEKMEHIVGRSNVSDTDLDKMSYSVDNGHPLLIIWPETGKDIKLIIKTALNNKYDLVPRGAGTGSVDGCRPDESIVIDLSRMNRILKINQEKKTAIVEPGVTIKKLNNALKKYNLMFPIIPTNRRTATVGGMIATNTTCAQAIKYGGTKNWVQDIEIMTGDDNTYDTINIKPFCGSEGIFGIITKATLELTDIIEEHSYYHFRFRTVKDLLQKVEEYRYNKNILSIDYIDRITSHLMKKDNMYQLIIEVSDDTGNIKEEDKIEEIKTLKRNINLTLGNENFTITEDPWIPPKGQEYFLEWLDKMRIPASAHIGYGTIHPRFRKNHTEKIKKMFKLVKKLGGKVNSEHGIGISKKEFLSEEEKRKIKKLKKIYDPKNIFNRNKIIDLK